MSTYIVVIALKFDSTWRSSHEWMNTYGSRNEICVSVISSL